MNHGGATTPATSAAPVVNEYAEAGKGVSEGLMLHATLKKMQADTDVSTAQAAKIRAETPDVSPTGGGMTPMTMIRDKMHAEMQKEFYDRDISEVERRRLYAEVENITTTNDLLALEKRLRELDLNEAAARAAFFASDYGKYYHFAMQDVFKGVSSAGQLRNTLIFKPRR